MTRIIRQVRAYLLGRLRNPTPTPTPCEAWPMAERATLTGIKTKPGLIRTRSTAGRSMELWRISSVFVTGRTLVVDGGAVTR